MSLMPAIASAHEVYVLTPAEIQSGTDLPPFAMTAVLAADLHQFVFWGVIALLTVFIVFFVSIVRPLERACAPIFKRGRAHAPLIARVTVGTAFLAAAYYGASYGPELPLAATFGAYTPIIRLALVIIGALMIAGIWARAAALAALVLFAIAVYFHGSYMLTYTNYMGEILVLLILGASHERIRGHTWFARAQRTLAPYSFLILRVCFGISLLYAALYAKILHNNLALQVAALPLAGHPYAIAHYLHFEPHFLVLGAAIVEIVISLFFILGIEIRFTSLFLEFWLALSLIFFGEVVWPHLILIGIPIAFIIYGYDKYSLEGYFFKKRKMEPVL